MYETKIDRYIFKKKQRGESPLGKPVGSTLKERTYYGAETEDSDGDITGYIILTKQPG